jgi:heme/copper-type cytochrome/quinol oxidase subunit 2
MQNSKRRVIDLHSLPMWVQYLIAIVVAGLVAFMAWHIARSRPAPGWLGPSLAVWMWLGPALIVFFVVKRLVKWLSGR